VVRTVRGRLGFLPTDSLLIYGTGGWLYGQASASRVYQGNTTEPLCAANCSIGALAENKSTWVVGAGFEYFVWRALTFTFEYLYAELGGQDGVHIENLPGGGISDVRLYQSTSFRLNVIRAGLNYHF